MASEAVVGGGILATELTLVFSRMGDQGVRAILGNSPFPVMQTAYEGRALSDNEIRALVGFLQQADKEHSVRQQQASDVGLKLFGGGAGGVVVLLGFYGLVGRRRKRGSVNQAIYDRQVKSE